jgi:hypothetical protein
MLMLYRPRQTYMPYRRPRPYMQQDAYNRQLQQQFQASRRVPAPEPSEVVPVQALKDLAELHDSGELTDDEFAQAKTRLLADS